jgi:hypothetical protein
MAKLYAEHEREHKGTQPPKKGMPWWPLLLLLAFLAIPLIWSWAQRPQGEQTAYFNPSTQSSTVIEYQNRAWVPVPNAATNQATFPPDQMKIVGHDKGYDLYANVAQGAEGGGGGPVTPGETPPRAEDRIYLRTGPNTYVPLMWR